MEKKQQLLILVFPSASIAVNGCMEKVQIQKVWWVCRGSAEGIFFFYSFFYGGMAQPAGHFQMKTRT